MPRISLGIFQSSVASPVRKSVLISDELFSSGLISVAFSSILSEGYEECEALVS